MKNLNSLQKNENSEDIYFESCSMIIPNHDKLSYNSQHIPLCYLENQRIKHVNERNLCKIYLFIFDIINQ